MGRYAAAAVALVAVAIAACADGDGTGARCEEPRGSGAGVWAEENLRPELVELWRAGGLREGETLAYPVGLVVGPDHRAAIPDFRLGRVFVVGPDGAWAGAWTRRGEGPGEVLRPVAAAWTAEGRLAVFDVEGARVVWLDSAEAAHRTEELDPALTAPVVAGGSLAWAGLSPDGTAYLRPGPAAVEGRARAVDRTVAARPGGMAPDTLLRDTVPTLAAEGRFAGVPVPGAPRPVVAVGRDGGLLRGAADGSYRILEVGAPEGSRTALCREADPLPLTARERGRGGFPEGREELAAAIGEAPPPERIATFSRFFVGSSGRFWVQRERPVPGGSTGLLGVPGATYDVFDPDGSYLGSVEAPADARLQAASGDTAWALEFGELDEAHVVAYELRLVDVDGE